MEMSLHESALYYAGQGWPVLPLHSIINGACSCRKQGCISPGKHPRTRNGLKEATTDMETIRRWWTKWPDANIGIATGKPSGLVVLDVDPDKGGTTSLEMLISQHAPLETLTQDTGGHGQHHLFRYPTGTESLRNSAGKLGEGLDIRADGGYIVAAPSNHLSGQHYSWQGGPPEKDIPCDIPLWLLCLITQDKPSSSPTTTNLRLVANNPEIVPEGYRNTTLTQLAGRLRQEGKNEKAIEITLQEENRLKCKPPLDDDEISIIARSVSRYPVRPTAFLFMWRQYLLSEHGPLSSTRRHVLHTLSTHMNPEGRSCYPTIERLATETALSTKAVGIHLRKAVEEGWIEVYEHRGSGQAWKNHGYIARLPMHILDELDQIRKKVGNLVPVSTPEVPTSTSLILSNRERNIGRSRKI